MSQIAHPDIALVVEALDSVGQKYRMQRLARGGLLFGATAIVATLAAGMVAHWSGAGAWALAAMAGWAIVLALAAIVWLAKPFLTRHKPEWVARLVEQRVDGLHNGFTNALLLAARDDVQASPFTPLIYSEIREKTASTSIDQAVRYRELLPLAWRCGLAGVLALAAGALLWPQVSHGWRQMLSPTAFVPATSTIQIVSVRPGDTTLIKGQPLEVLLEITGQPEDQDVEARLYVEPRVDGKQQWPLPLVAPGRFASRIEHVDESMRYRVEVGGTQSRWFDVKVIEQIKLTSLSLSVTPPAYTKRPAQEIKVNAESASPVNVPEGSRIDVVAQIDTPVSSAMLQLAEDQPLTMQRQSDGRQFAASFSADKDVSLSVLLADGSGQVIARLPEPAIDLRATPDARPQVTMRWPSQDVAVAPDAEVALKADLKDDVGLSHARVLMSASADAPLEIASDLPLSGQQAFEFSHKLVLKPDWRKHGTVLRVQVEAIDNRSLGGDRGPQTTQSQVYSITLRDAEQIAKESGQRIDKLRDAIREMLKKQQDLHARTTSLKSFDASAMQPVTRGQTELHDRLLRVAETFQFEPADASVQKTLLMLARNPAAEAVELSTSLSIELNGAARIGLHSNLQASQRRIISTLESLLALLVATPELADQHARRGGDLPTTEDAIKDLKAALEEFVKQQQRILDATAPLAKKPVDDFSDKDKKTLDELAMSQEKLDAFMQEKIADFSKLAEQDMANASLLKELMEVYSEVTMAKDALKKKEIEIAVSAEEMGVELAKEITSNLEKWLVDTPDRIKWDQEDPLTKMDIPMAELPKELEDMIGELMEQQEDLLEEAEDTNANWADSLDKGAGWDAMDGPIANMSAKGVTGNQLPNNNEMGGRSGEGRSGKSQGEFVEETASGKGGRNTPTRLDPTAFQQGQIKDESKDPVGGATGGGKLSGQGGEGLEGPVPPGLDKEMQRLAQRQAQLRNAAERLNLQYQLGRYDNFKLLQSIAIMRRVEADLNANRYQNAMRRKDVLLDTMDTSRMLVGGQIHVQHDTSPTLSNRMEDQIHDAMKGDLPPAWSDALKTYYEKLGRQ